jgi:hypothetical protein
MRSTEVDNGSAALTPLPVRGRKLPKADAERLMGSIDTEGFVEALDSCLEIVLGPSPQSTEHQPSEGDPKGGIQPDTTLRWAGLVARAAAVGGWNEERRSLVASMEVNALYDLASELNERRSLS